MDDWRTTLQPDDRQRIVDNIMETLKRDRKNSGPDELSKIATTFEETMYMASTSQSDYRRRVSTIQSNSAGSTENPSDLASIDSTAQTGHIAVDWQEECYQKIKSMKGLYLSDLSVMYQKISIKCEQHDSVLNVPKSEKIERLKLFKNMLERTLQFLNVSKNNIVPAVKEKLAAYEKQIIGILNSNRPRKPVDWQEEIYQKIKSMKELYLSDLNDMYQKISIKCQQHDSVLNVSMPEQIERLKLFKKMLDRTIQFLNVSKSNIVPAVKDKIPAYEKQIIGVLNPNRPRKLVSAQQQIQQPGGHPLSMQQQQPLEQQQHGNQGTASTIISGKSSVAEQPLERLIKVVKSVSPKAFSASVSDIGSVISMIDRIAGSAPGNGSRAAVGEDLVAMTKCRMQARNFSTQEGSSATKKMRRNTSAMPLNHDISWQCE